MKKDISKLENLISKLSEIDSKKVKYGIFGAKAMMPASDGGRITIGKLARIMEQGRTYRLKGSVSIFSKLSGETRVLDKGTLIHIPARPFFTYANIQIKKDFNKVFKIQFKLLMNNKNSANNMLNQLGKFASETVKDTMRNRALYAPLSDLQIWKKGNDTPLIDTGLLLNSVSYEVNDG